MPKSAYERSDMASAEAKTGGAEAIEADVTQASIGLFACISPGGLKSALRTDLFAIRVSLITPISQGCQAQKSVFRFATMPTHYGHNISVKSKANTLHVTRLSHYRHQQVTPNNVHLVTPLTQFRP